MKFQNALLRDITKFMQFDTSKIPFKTSATPSFDCQNNGYLENIFF